MKIKNTLLLLFLSLTTSLLAQKDTLYFNSVWNKSFKKNAVYFRPIPLKKIGNLIEVKDYYINGNLQMEGFYLNKEKQTLEGKTIWYYENGNVQREQEHKQGRQEGLCTFYNVEGLLRAKGIYKDNYPFTGTFTAPFSEKKITEYDNEKITGWLTFYKGSEQVAMKEIYQGFSISEIQYFNKKGESIGQISYKDDEALTGKYIWFYEDDYEKVSIKTIINYKNSFRNGALISYDKAGKQIAFAICKDDKIWDGTFLDDKTMSNYKNGMLHDKQTSYYTKNLKLIKSTNYLNNDKLNGESIFYDRKGKEIARGIYKDNKPWDGSFFDKKKEYLATYKSGVKSSATKKNNKFKERQFTCSFVNDEPYSGKICKGLNVTTYSKGIITKIETYKEGSGDRIFETVFYDENGNLIAENTFHNNKELKLTYKDGNPFNGQVYKERNETFNSFKNGMLNGPFMYQDSDFQIKGTNKNGLWDGNIHFTNNLDGSKFSCTYKKDLPINGKTVKKKLITNYKNGKKNGLEYTAKRNLYYGKRYDSIVKNYKNDQLNGAINYFYKGDKVATGTYKKNKPYKGTFYENQDLVNTYKKGALKSVTEYFSYLDYTKKTTYKKNKKNGIVTLSLKDSILSKGVFKNEVPYKGTFTEIDKDDTNKFTFTDYINGKKEGIQKVYNLRDNILLRQNFYKNDIIQKELNTIQFKGDTTLTGNYKNGKPFNGLFYKKTDIIESLFHYENGIKKGKQYYAVANSKMENLLDSISYKNGKPFNGNELEMLESNTHQHNYKDGQLIKTNIYNWGISEVPNYEVAYSKNGYISYHFKGRSGFQKTKNNTSKEVLNKMVYTNEDSTNGILTFLNKDKEIGKIVIFENKIEDINFSYTRDGRATKIYKDTSNLIIEIRTENENIKYVSDYNFPDPHTYAQFLNFSKLLFVNYSNGSVYYYLDSTTEPYSSCVIKDGKPYHGIVIRHYNDNSYEYEEYIDGKEFKKIRTIDKNEILELLKK